MPASGFLHFSAKAIKQARTSNLAENQSLYKKKFTNQLKR